MAPEQALDPRNADARADIYSLGCTLHFLLTGSPPHEGESVLATLLAHREAPVSSLRRTRPDCPPALDALFQRMLAKRPGDRPASMSEVVLELERIQKGTPRSFALRRSILALGLAASVVVGLVFLLNQSPSSPGTKPAPVAEKGEAKNPPIEMVRIEAGRFQMGSLDGDPRCP